MSDMRSVKQDSIGLWVSADAMIARPIKPSKWMAGDKVNVRRDTGLVFIREKNFDDDYEVWATMSMTSSGKKNYTIAQQKELWEHYRKDALQGYGHVYWKEIK